MTKHEKYTTNMKRDQQANDIDEDAIVVHQNDRHGLPMNAEVRHDEVAKHFITPTSAIFHRNHDDIVQVPQDVAAVEEEWQLAVSVGDDVVQSTNTKTDDGVVWPRSESLIVTYGQLLRGGNVERIATTATLECAGNRRKDLAQQGGEAEGIQWDAGAISTVEWYGPAIRPLLLHMGVPDPYGHHDDAVRGQLIPSDGEAERDCAAWARPLHLHMLSAQPSSESDKPGSGEFFGASVPFAVAMHPQQQCIVATHHNGAVLTQAHGFPLRVVIPGHVGARWVKWLRGLHISTQPEQSPPMRLDYKNLTVPAGLDAKQQEAWKESMMGETRNDMLRKVEVERKEPIQALGVGSHIQEPVDGAVIARSSKRDDQTFIHTSGYAVGQDGSPVTLVEVVAFAQGQDESVTQIRARAAAMSASQWSQALVTTELNKDGAAEGETMRSDQQSFAWSLWQCDVSICETDAGADTRANSFAIVARATTESGKRQEQESAWNVRGFSTRSWPVVANITLR